MQNITLNVAGMSCNHCVNAVESSVGQLTGVESVNVDLATAQVAVAFNAATITTAQIKATIEEQGYDVV